MGYRFGVVMWSEVDQKREWKMTKMEDNQNGRRPKWKTTKMKDDQNGRRQKWKTIKMEDDQNGRRPKWKTTKIKDDQNGRQFLVFVAQYLATQTGGATVNNIFEVRFTDTKIE